MDQRQQKKPKTRKFLKEKRKNPSQATHKQWFLRTKKSTSHNEKINKLTLLKLKLLLKYMVKKMKKQCID